MMSLNYNIENIVEEMEKAMSIFPDRAEPLYSLGAYCNKIGEHNLAYKYLIRALPIDINKVKEKYILFVDEQCYGKYVYDELSVACFWTERYNEGLQHLLQIIDDETFSHHKERLLENRQHFRDRMDN
jgi:tetratricopeptide (TPR) repeat protein